MDRPTDPQQGPRHAAHRGHASSRDEPTHPFFVQWAEAVIRHRFLLIVLCLALAGAAMWQVATNTHVDTSIEAFTANDGPTAQLLEEFRDEFGRDEFILVLIEGDVFTMPYLEKVQRLTAEFEALQVDVETVGQRKSERDALRRGASAGAGEPEAGEGGAGGGEAPGEAVATAGDAAGGFGDFDDGGDDAGAEATADAEGGDDWAGVDASGVSNVFDEVISLTNVRKVRGEEGAIVVRDLGDPMPTPETLPEWRDRVLGDPSLVGMVVGESGKHSVISLRPFFMAEEDLMRVKREVQKVTAAYDAEGFDVLVTGLPALADELNSAMLGDMGTLLAIGMVLMFLLLVATFRGIVQVIGPGAVVMLAALGTFGAMAALGMTVTMLSTILPSFIIVVGVGDSIHLLSIWRERRKETGSNRDAIVFALGSTGMPVLFTTLTTMVGLLSFQLSDLEAISDMGLGGAIGVALALLFSLVLLPISLTFLSDPRGGAQAKRAPSHEATVSAARRSPVDRLLGWTNGLSRPGAGASKWRRRNLTLVGCVGLFGIALAGMSLLYVYHNPLAWIPSEWEIGRSFEVMDREVGGTANVQLLVDGGGEFGVKDRELVTAVDDLVEHIKAYRDPQDGRQVVGNSLGLTDIVKDTYMALNEGDPDYRVIPETQRGVSDALFMFENAGPDDLRRIATTDMSRSQVTLRVKWLEATAYLPLTDYIEAGIEEHIGDAGRVQPTGAVYTLVTVVATLIGDLLKSFGGAFIAVTLMMILLLRSVKLGLIAMVPNLLPILCIMAFMGYGDIPIDMNNLLIASIALGLAVDDTIHFLHHFRVAYDSSGDVEWAIEHAFHRAGRAIITTTVILSSGFFVFMAADLVNMQRFGSLTGLTMVFAVLIDLMFAPALLRLFFKDRPAAAPAAA